MEKTQDYALLSQRHHKNIPYLQDNYYFFFFRFWKSHSKGLTLRSLYSGGKKLFVFASHGNNSKS